MILDLAIWILIFLVSTFVLVKSSDKLSDTAEKIGLYFGIPSFIIGVTIVSMGTSLPELISSIIAVYQGSSEIVVASVLGSNITNIFLVLGVAAIVAKKLQVSYDLLHVDLPLFTASAFFLLIILIDGEIEFLESILAIAGAGIYLLYTISVRKDKQNRTIKKELKEEHPEASKNITWTTLPVLTVSSLFLFISATLTVESIVQIAEILNTAKEFIAVIAISLGTSLPELMVAVNAARKSQPEIVVGGVLGSSIFNSFGVIGISSLIGEVIVPATLTSFILPVMIVATLLYFFITQERQITKWEGWTLIIFYILFISEVINIA